MELLASLLSIAAAIGIPFLLHRATHPKRELRFAIVPLDAGAGTWRMVVWSTSRADIPSALYDDGRPIVFQLNPGVVPRSITTNSQGTPFWRNGELHLGPKLLHTDFFATAEFLAQHEFTVVVEKSLIDVPIVEDRSLASRSQDAQLRVVQRSKARARLTLRIVGLWLLAIGFGLFVVGLGLGLGGIEPLGSALGGTSLILLPSSLLILAVDALRRLAKRRSRA